jgi:YesN/AraC family two-component response regulator
MEYYAELKNKTAKKLLRENELSIKEISEKLCFDTPNYFSKTFKKLNGLTPTQYKKRYNIKLG